jgi:hypothetical protein
LDGTVPVMLLSTTLSCRRVRLPSSGGRVPDSTLRDSSRNVRVGTCPSTAGMLPFRPRPFSNNCETPPIMVEAEQDEES